MNAQPLPYGHHTINDDDVSAVRLVLEAQAERSGTLAPEDIEEVLGVLRSGLLAQGPQVARFEAAFSEAVGSDHAVACSSGTAALHLALAAAGVGTGDLCVVPAITFLATATAVRFCGAEVVFADVDRTTGLMTAEGLAAACRRAGRPVTAVLPVHLGGRSCELGPIADEAAKVGAKVIEDGCHALGTDHPKWGKLGDCRRSVASVFSFHPVKTIACGEGGMVTTNDAEMAARLSRLRNHGVTRDPALMVDPALSLDASGQPHPWSYEQLELGFNYRMSELEAALGRCQLAKLDAFVAKRRELVEAYDALLAPLSEFCQPTPCDNLGGTSFHLYAVRLNLERLRLGRAELMRRLASRGIGTQVHYIPVYRQPYFVQRYGASQLAGAEAYYRASLSLPLFPKMDVDDVRRVVLELTAALGAS